MYKQTVIVKEILQVTNLVASEKIVRAGAVIVTLISILLGIFVSLPAGFIVFSSYISGYIVCWILIEYRNKTNSYIHQLASLYCDRYCTKKTVSHSCSICDDLSCRRHQKSKSVTPWKYLKVIGSLDSSIEHFYERIIENFVTSWYKQFTDDEDFPNELRYCLRYSTATVINRFLELNVGDIVANRLIPCAVKHIDDCLYMRQIGKLKNVRFNDVIVEYLGKRMHAAATNRRNELEYLQNLVASLLIHVLPENYLKCRNYSIMIREILAGWVFLPLMDVLADPNIINSLVILGVTYKSKKLLRVEKKEETTEFLENFVKKSNTKVSSFATNLNKIKNNTDLLYAFMQFLKKQDHVNLLQFCLDVDDFNNKLLTPDLSKKQLEELHSDALKLYKDYLDKDSYNFINCPSYIFTKFNYLMKEYHSVEKLTKLSRLLYKAYDHTFSILEEVWLPQFFHSSEFYSFICGTKIVPTYSKQSVKSKKFYEQSSTYQGTVAKLSSGLGKIKGVLKTTQPVEGAIFPMESQTIEDGNVDDILLGDCKQLFRDLTMWKVSIPTYQTPATNKIVHFYINVERKDLASSDNKQNWVVLRKDQDFYTLKAKLVEFHGESEICDSPLPSRKAGSFLETRMVKYEEFLRKLLQKPTLRGSDLLHAFLTTDEDFTLYITTITSNIQDIGNIYQSVAYKLRKEKGQRLDSFMTAFLNSTGTKNDLEWAEIGEELDLGPVASNESVAFPKTYRNHIFNDNFGIQYKALKDTMSGSFNPEGFTECLFYLMKYIFNVPNGILRLYASFCSIAQYLVDVIVKHLIERKIMSSLSQANLAFLIRLLEDVVFSEHIPPTRDELEKRKERAFSELEKVFPPMLTKLCGNNITIGLRTLLEMLQNQHYNKQLAYNVLDIVLTEMYPVLDKNESHYGTV